MPRRVEGHLVTLATLTPETVERGTRTLRQLVALGDGIVTVRTPDRQTALLAYDTLRDSGPIEWLSDTDFRSLPPTEAASEHRRCESCGQTMRARMHRVTDENGKKVCDNCARTGLNKREWNVAYASLPPAYQREAQRRDEATVAGLAVLAEVRKCPSCQGQGTYGDEDERTCPRCNGDGVIDAPKKTSGLQTVAHDSGDGETIFHCPFCGSGAVAGGSDGTVTCNFCHNAFTVQVQPRHTNMPQTIDGQPYNIPGMPGGGPDAGAASQQEAQDQGDAQQGAPQPGESPSADANKGASPAADKAAQDGAQPSGKPNPFAKGSMLVVPGGVLPLDAALQRLALQHADDREAVLARVKEENAR